MANNIDDINGRLANWHERMKAHDDRIPKNEGPPKVEQIAFQVVVENDQVLMRFGKPIAWMALTPDQAMIVAQDLVNKVKQIKGV